MPVPMTINQAADLIDLSIQEVYPKMTNLTNPDDDILKCYHQETTEDYYEKDSSLSGITEAARMTDGAIIYSESPVQGFDKTYTQVFHGVMMQFTLYEWKFGIKRRQLEGVIRDLDKGARRKRARILTEYLENSIGANTSMTVVDNKGNYPKSVTGGDGLALINSAHTREDGGSSWSNVVSDGSTSNMDLAPDAVRAAHRTASLIRDPKGNLMDVRLDTLVCRKGSSVFFDAIEMNGALKRNFAPNSAENNGAPYGAFDVIALPYLSTSAAAYWWMFDSSLKSAQFGPQYRESQGIVMDAPHADYKTKTICVSSTVAFDYGHNDGRNWVGSTGVNA